jgi:predicted DNA-binding protein with PD1-like motif
MTRIITLLCLAEAGSLLAQTAPAAGPPPRVFGASQVQEVYRVVLDRNALLLESILDVIKQKNVQDGHVMITAGSVQECRYHYVTSTATKPKDEFKTVKGAFEILNGGGIIANGEPHIHITLSEQDKGAFGGHLENGCRILYLGEVTITKYAGPALTRQKNENGVALLNAK